MYTTTPGFHVWSEKDWNDAVVREVEAQGSGAASLDKYRASKVLAERAAWAWMEEHKGEARFDMAVVLPAGVFGPTFCFESLADLTGSMQFWWSIVKGDLPDAMLRAFG